MLQLTFFSHTFSENGASPDSEKISAIVNSKSPTNVEEVRSFLSMAQYVAMNEALIGAGVVAYFDPNKETNVLVDAGLVRLGAVLTQNGKVLCYASHALTDLEQQYSQTEREMSAVVYAAEHFHLYLYGSRFIITSDH